MNYIFPYLWLCLDIFFLFYLIIKIKNKNYNYIFPLLLIIILLYTTIGGYFFTFANIIPFKEQLVDISESSINTIHFIFILSAMFFILGIITVKKEELSFKENNIKVISSNYFSIIPFLCIVLFLFSYGVDGWLLREGYVFVPYNNTAYKLFKILFPLSAASLFFIKNKSLKYILYFLLISLLFSSSSRSSIFVPVLYILMSFLLERKFKLSTLIINVFVLFFLLATALSFRGLNSQGLLGNILNIINGQLSLNSIVNGLNYAFSFSYYANLYTIKEIMIPYSVIISSVNPLPSSFVDIDSMIMAAKINPFSPTPAISMLYSCNSIFLWVYMYLSGLLFEYAKKTFNSKLGFLFLIGMLLAFSVLSLQYHLRECTRILYYILIMVVVYKLFVFLKKI